MHPLIDTAQLPRFTPWFSIDKAPPAWSSLTPDEWFSAMSSLWKSPPAVAAGNRFIHRDLHPGNVLFSELAFPEVALRDAVSFDGMVATTNTSSRRSFLTGIVDWTNAAWGPFEADVSRCRVEIALLAGFEAADNYLSTVKHLCTDILPIYDYRWDILVALELAPWVSDLVECANETGAQLTEASVAATLNHYIVQEYEEQRC